MAAMDEESAQPSAPAPPPAARAKSETQGIPDTIPAMPSGGLELYRRYLEENTRYPDSDTLQQVQTVDISFVVNSQGRPVNIEIIKSPGQEFSTEAIRLLRDGPLWTQAFVGGTPALIRSRISVEFIPPSE
jgi:protein TonB